MEWLSVSRRGIDFLDLENLQQTLTRDVKADPTRAFLLFSEPLPVYTYGRKASASDFSIGGAPCVAVIRGGRWTYHGPGQVVLYPIVQLRALGLGSLSVSQFLRILARAVLAVLSEYGISATLRCNPLGLYVGESKLVSFGIHVSQGVTSHGLALYMTDQSQAFSRIHPCGILGQRITSLQELGVAVEWESLQSALSHHIKKGFKNPKN